eukprot:TRINITY_DN7467_c0_g4_i1.p1 TRINITY_DN7467_c0_g4~~TRINITY_DN7467_c0_g4_i1.p1  ORF type:complete len:797 (+),score=112.76 TRINITY_DN7467_c0_g4_i1:72-2462(+)
MTSDSNVLVTEMEFESDIKREPNSLRHWWRYLQYKSTAEAASKNQLFERCLQHLPSSYKIWFQYLTERTLQVVDRPLDNKAWENVNKVFERALVYMGKMPRIWTEYILFLIRQRKITQTRRTIDRALQTLPITQHDKIWKVAMVFLKEDYLPVETACRLWNRYLQLEPFLVEDFVLYLKKQQQPKWNNVIVNTFIKALNDSSFVSVKGRTKHDIWVELCHLMSKLGSDLKLEDSNLTIDKVIRSGIKRFPNEVGQLWCALADHSIRCGLFDKARALYEEGIASVSTVKDFSQIFDSYTQFEESLLTAKMDELDSEPDSTPQSNIDSYTAALMSVTGSSMDLSEEVDYRLERLQHLLDRRPELLNTVVLRQNPHNVHEWHKRVSIFKSQPEMVIRTYTDAVKTVDVTKALGKPHSLWTGFARFYEDRKELGAARGVFENAVKTPFKSIDELASVWCEYTEMEVRHQKYRRALDHLRVATATNFSGQGSWKKSSDERVQDRVWRSVKLWSLYADLNESLCTLQSTKRVYDRMVYLKVVTPKILLNYASLLKDKSEWEEAFKIYQQGIALFQWPIVHDVWVEYIDCFVRRLKGGKVERTRDLLEQCVSKVPKKFALRFYMMYVHFEERFGLARQCLAIYDRALAKVSQDELPGLFHNYIRTAKKFFEITRSREIYHKAIDMLPAKMVLPFILEFIELEKKLGEIDRARALYEHASQYIDPRRSGADEFFDTWKDFERDHGNVTTFAKMSGVRRAIDERYANLPDLEEAARIARETRAAKEEEEKKIQPGAKREYSSIEK